MWAIIQEVLGKRKSRKEQIYIYISEKERKLIEDIWDMYIKDWETTIYQKQERVLKQKWYGTKGEKGFKTEIIEEEKTLGSKSEMMEMPNMSSDDLIRIVGNQKNGKAAGTDCIKAEVLKHLVKNKEFVEITARAINKIPEGKIHRRMKESRTTMLKKCQKPGIKDWRPIAVGSIMSKTICGFYREKIEDHLKEKNLRKEIQYGFTKGGRVEHCIFTINHITNMTYESRKN